MSRFNTEAVLDRPTQNADTINLAGGEAFSQSAKAEFASILLTSFVTDQYYRSADDGLARTIELLDQVEPVFAAKAAVYARNEFGMRSISHVVAAEIAHRVKGESWTKRFIDSVVRRPDDMTEIVAYYLTQHGRPLPNSVKKGLASAFTKFDRYQLAKYRGEGKAVSLVDLVNLVHPVPTGKNAEALRDLINGKLRSDSTWESKLSSAGTAEDKGAAKAEAWSGLLRERKIGYFALLRNLRNISEQAPELVPIAAELLVDEKLIRKSLVLPFRFLTALREVTETAFVKALNRALDISLVNVPEFPGKSLIVIDHSGSMQAPIANGVLERKLVGDVFAAALFKNGDADTMVFGTNAGYVKGLNPDDSTLTLARTTGSVDHGWGTDFHAIFRTANKKYDRIVIFSDMQGWIGHSHPGDAFSAYKRQTGANPFVYSFDLAGYGSLQFPENRVFQIAGFSEKTFDIMKMLEQDRNALVHKIESVKF